MVENARKRKKLLELGSGRSNKSRSSKQSGKETIDLILTPKIPIPASEIIAKSLVNKFKQKEVKEEMINKRKSLRKPCQTKETIRKQLFLKK